MINNILEVIKNWKSCEESDKKIYIWTPEEIKADPSKAEVWLLPFLVGNNAPVSIICPGGAYAIVSHGNEGSPFAMKLNERGHNAFVLNYRVARHARYPQPMEDLARAIQVVRKYAAAFNVDGNRLSVWGSSAAGHLCSYFAARYDRFAGLYEDSDISLRPDSAVLVYPVINFTQETHVGTRENLLGRKSSLDEWRDKSSDLIAGSDYPPTFIFHCKDDKSVPISNSLRMDAALTRLGIKHELYLAESGGHGCGIAKGTSAEGWIDKAIDFIESC